MYLLVSVGGECGAPDGPVHLIGNRDSGVEHGVGAVVVLALVPVVVRIHVVVTLLKGAICVYQSVAVRIGRVLTTCQYTKQ